MSATNDDANPAAGSREEDEFRGNDNNRRVAERVAEQGNSVKNNTARKNDKLRYAPGESVVGASPSEVSLVPNPTAPPADTGSKKAGGTGNGSGAWNKQ